MQPSQGKWRLFNF